MYSYQFLRLRFKSVHSVLNIFIDLVVVFFSSFEQACFMAKIGFEAEFY